MMSPDTKDGVHPNVSRDVGRSRRAMGRTQPDHGIGIDLQYAREKTATGSLTNPRLSPAYERGKAWWNAKGVDPDVQHAGGVPVVVRGRESLSHGEGEQFKLLEVQTT